MHRKAEEEADTAVVSATTTTWRGAAWAPRRRRGPLRHDTGGAGSDLLSDGHPGCGHPPPADHRGPADAVPDQPRGPLGQVREPLPEHPPDPEAEDHRVQHE